MASNSLLECLVFARSAATAIQNDLEINADEFPTVAEFLSKTKPANPKEIETLTTTIRELTWKYAGIVRSNAGLATAKNELSPLKQHINKLAKNHAPTKALIELQNLVQTAELIISSATARQESRGVHYNQDIPETSPTAQNSIIKLSGATTNITFATDIHSLINIL